MRQNLQAGLPGHVVIEGDDVEPLRPAALEAFAPAEARLDLKAARPAASSDEPGQAGVVVDIEKSERWLSGHSSREPA